MFTILRLVCACCMGLISMGCSGMKRNFWLILYFFFTSFSIPTVLSIVARRKVKECLDDMDVSLMTSYLFVTYPHALYCIIKIDICTVHLVTSFNLRSLACCYVCWILDPVFSIVNIF